MGLFGDNIKIEKDHFNGCFNLERYEVANFRERQGFKVKIENGYGIIRVEARKSKFLKHFVITNTYSQSGSVECSIAFIDFDKNEIMSFIKSNFRYNGSSYELPNGDNLQQYSLNGQPSNCLYFKITNNSNSNFRK